YTYRVVVSGACTPAATSNGAAFTVNTAPAITAQPSASAICAGANTTFSVTATSATGYQWQENTGSGYSNISNGGVYSGATTATLTLTGATSGMSGYTYRVVVSGACTPAATSNGAALTVNTAPAITAQPVNRIVSEGANTTFSVTTTGATGYQWQMDAGGGYSNISNGGIYSGATTATLTLTGVTAGMNGYLYRVVATGTCTPAATSASGSLSISTLPVELVHFASKAISGGVETTWKTVSERNSSHFELLHSDDGIVFKQVASVDALGDSQTGKHYSFLHKQPANGTNYYQLLQFDKDGAKKDYGIKTVSFSTISNADVSVFPNPATHTVTVNFPAKTYTKVEVVDLLGKLVIERKINATDTEEKIDLDRLPRGTYTVILSTGNDSVV
ncbi:MAG: T9SS type A sorting domain-containing protein, partial [Sphingobacteriales bacterium]